MSTVSDVDVERVLAMRVEKNRKLLTICQASDKNRQVVKVRVQELASLYHHSYGQDDNSNRKRKLKKLSELHYVKASQLFLLVDRLAKFIRTILERAGLVETQLPAMMGEGARYRLVLQVLHIVLRGRGQRTQGHLVNFTTISAAFALALLITVSIVSYPVWSLSCNSSGYLNISR